MCIIVADLTALLHPSDPPDLRLHRLIRELATARVRGHEVGIRPVLLPFTMHQGLSAFQWGGEL